MKTRRAVLPCALAGLLVLFAARFVEVKQAALQSLQLCAGALLPSLLPFSVASNLFWMTGADRPFGRLLQKPLRLLGLPPAAAAPLITGIVGGYPIGLQSLGGLYQRGSLNKREAVVLSRFCNNAGPAFILGAGGLALFGSLAFGLLLWLVHLLSALLTGLLVFQKARPSQDAPPDAPQRPISAVLPEAVQKSCLGLLYVCGFVVFFGALCGLLKTAGLPPQLGALSAGALELSNGLFALAALPTAQRFVLASLILSWGGVCVHFQGAAALHAAGLPARPYVLGKLIQAAVSVPVSVAVGQLCGLFQIF